MTYNVQNLFDTLDDPRSEDETFLPLSEKKKASHKSKCEKAGTRQRRWDCLFLDWTPQLLNEKMKNLAQQVLSVRGGKGPDVLLLAEVENKDVVNEFNQKYLARSGYKVYHVDSHDPRGIDQAILSRLPFVDVKYHRISYSKRESWASHLKELRGILHTVFSLTGKTKKLHVLALHLPSQGSPFVEREIVLKELNKVLLQIPSSDLVVAGGDFNITSKEWESESVYPRYLEKLWSVAHLQCKDCQGTYHYQKDWSFFDMLLLRKGTEKKPLWSWEASSVKVVNSLKVSFPSGFNPNTKMGASDHFPLFGELFQN